VNSHLTSLIQPSYSLFDESFSQQFLGGSHLLFFLGTTSLEYAILDPATNRFIALEQFTLPTYTNETERFEQLSHIFQQCETLQKDFKKISLAFAERRSTLVPAALYDKQALSQYLAFNHTMDANDVAGVDYLPNANVYNAYVEAPLVTQFFRKQFPKIQVLHHASVLLESLVIRHKHSTQQQVFAHFEQGQFDLVVMAGKQLVLHNSFAFETKEDVVYYILFVCEQLELSPEKINLHLSGEIPAESETTNLLRQYIGQLTLESRPANFSYSGTLQSAPAHRFFHLFNQALCA